MDAEHDRHRRSRPSHDGLTRLASAVGVNGEPRILRRLGGGLGSATHVIAFGDSDRLVLKRYHDADVVAAEWDRLRFAHSAGLPVPRPVAVDLSGAWFGTPALAMERIPGRPDVSPADVDGYLNEVASATVRMHAVPLTTATGPIRERHRVDLWTPPAHIPAGLLTRATARRLVDILTGGIVTADRGDPVLNHCDFHPGNLVWRGGRLAGIVDWSAAKIGFRAWDLAYFRMELAILVDAEAADELLARYERMAGWRSSDQAVWDLLCLYNAHNWGHLWLFGYQEQGRKDLDIAEFRRRVRRLARRTLKTV